MCSEHGFDEGPDKETTNADGSHGHTSEGDGQAGITAQVAVSVAAALSNAGQTLEGAEAELVLNPLRLAFETKNIKIVELALDCLHVCI